MSTVRSSYNFFGQGYGYEYHSSGPGLASRTPMVLVVWSSLPETISPAFQGTMAMICGAHVGSGCSGGVEERAARFAQLCAWLVHEVPAPPPGCALVLHAEGPSDPPGRAKGADREKQHSAREEDPSEDGLRRRPRDPPRLLRPLVRGLPPSHVPLQPLLARLGVGELLLLARLLLLEKQV